ncbi:enoyl-CoA hydratase/isomerase family protein [Actinomadura scrupuli]|uniref:enoyl-CoA hydratase/isomerase family protein n=1 Tax=Actinomadura scrupuli TaxID=559629 RepID=UPI003D98650A
MADKLLLDYAGSIATITNNNPDKHNAFDDEMDELLWQMLGELRGRRDLRAVIWRAEGRSFSSGRDVSSIGRSGAERTHHELMSRGHQGVRQLFDLDAPVLVSCQGWSIGAAFQRALLCDIRVAAEGARFMLPETGHGVIPDTGGVARLFQICGHGVASDLVLTGRPMGADEAYAHGVVSRVVPADRLDEVVREMAEKIAAAPAVTIKMARRVIAHLAEPQVRASMAEELIAQTFVNKSDDYAEFRAARAESRPPHYTGS